MDFFFTKLLSNKDELIRFGGQKVKGQGPSWRGRHTELNAVPSVHARRLFFELFTFPAA